MDAFDVLESLERDEVILSVEGDHLVARSDQMGRDEHWAPAIAEHKEALKLLARAKPDRNEIGWISEIDTTGTIRRWFNGVLVEITPLPHRKPVADGF